MGHCNTHLIKCTNFCCQHKTQFKNLNWSWQNQNIKPESQRREEQEVQQQTVCCHPRALILTSQIYSEHVVSIHKWVKVKLYFKSSARFLHVFKIFCSSKHVVEICVSWCFCFLKVFFRNLVYPSYESDWKRGQSTSF